MEVYVALRIGNRTPSLFEFFLEFSNQIVSQTPVIVSPTPRSNHQVYRGIGKFRDGDQGNDVLNDLIGC